VHVYPDVNCRNSQVKKRTGRKMGLKRRRWLSGKLLKRKRDPTLPYGHLSLRREEEKVKRKRK
jgi:hypothetical protein